MSKIDDKLNEVLGIAEEPNELEVIQKEAKDYWRASRIFEAKKVFWSF